VRRSLEYFGSRYPDAGVRRLTLVGGGAKLRNIDAYFTRELGIPSTRGNPFSGIAVRASRGSEYIDENAPLFAVALGLALRDVA
jgi:Tfp pilus assembly PilM family ATPase